MLLIFFLVFLALNPAGGEEFAGEPFLLGSSVADNGTAGALPSKIYTATQYLDYPGDFGSAKLLSLELSTLPIFSDLSQTLNGALSYAIDGQTRINVFGQTVTTSDIAVLPILKGTTQDRLNDPSFRPSPCNGCSQLRDVVYMANINIMRKYDWEFPRIDISSRPIPVQFSAGVTTKYYYEELEGGDFLSQNLNADLGMALKFFWGFDPVSHLSDRNVKIQVGGFEILPTRQRSDFSSVMVYEHISRRYHLSASWEEELPSLHSTLALGITQKSEQGRVPSMGMEWGFQNLLFIRGGFDDDYLSAGASLAYRWASVHYALRYHELGTSLYQVSLQVELP